MGWIAAENLGKCFKHYDHPLSRLRDWIPLGQKQRYVPHWVVRGAHFEVQPGEAVGIIGTNGAGKSTLLSLIKGTLRPSEGRIRREGRIAALDLGLGFHPDFTGRQNLFTGAGLYGLATADVERLLPEIVRFAEIGRYLDEPMRTYSTGMQLRLAFSLATAVRPDMLLIDEALAVGDAYFQQKCIARIRSFRRDGTTLVLVSHDAAAIKSLCDRALLLDDGLLVREGAPDSVLEYYNAIVARQTAEYVIREAEDLGGEAGSMRSGDQRAVIERVELMDESGSARAFQVGAPVRIQVKGRAMKAVDELTVGIAIRDRLGNEVFGINTHHLGVACRSIASDTSFRAEFALPMNLGCGNYTLTTALHAGSVHVEGSYDWWDKVCVFQVLPGPEPPFVGCVHLPTIARLETSCLNTV